MLTRSTLAVLALLGALGVSVYARGLADHHAAISTRPAARAPAPAHTVLYAFSGNKSDDGATPRGRLLPGDGGVLYGTTKYGGGSSACSPPFRQYGCGTIFALTPSGSGYAETVLFRFDGTNGAHPEARLVSNQSGALFGTTYDGGQDSDGTVFELTTGRTLRVLHDFAGKAAADGAHSAAALSSDNAGNFYGTTVYGGTGKACSEGCGTVFELSPHGASYTEQVLYSFQGGNDGAFPYGGVMVDTTTGALYGTTRSGGGSASCPLGCGTAFVLMPFKSGYRETVLYRFQGAPDGANPNATLISDDQRNLYGTTENGGNTCFGGTQCGTVYELSLVGSHYQETILYSFASNGDGANPEAPLIRTGGGFLLGTTANASLPQSCDCGTVFQLARSGKHYAETLLYVFANSRTDGATPVAGLVRDKFGALYGTTSHGGPHNDGTVYRILP